MANPSKVDLISCKKTQQLTGTTKEYNLTCHNSDCHLWKNPEIGHDIFFEEHPNIPFMSNLTCNHCKSGFSICSQCQNTRVQYSSKRSIMDHCRKYHADFHSTHLRKRIKRRKTTETVSIPKEIQDCDIPGVVLTLDDDVLSEPDNALDDLQPTIPTDTIVPISSVPLVLNAASNITSATRGASQKFFLENQNGNGLKYLAGLAQFGLPNIPTNQLDSKEVEMLLQTADLAANLTFKNRTKLAHLTRSIINVVAKQTVEEINVLNGTTERRAFTIQPISTPYEMRRQVIGDGQTCISENIAHPGYVMADEHAVSLPSDCLQDIAGHGFLLDFIGKPNPLAVDSVYPIKTIPSTLMGKKLFDNSVGSRASTSTLNVWMNEWSDDFEPNNSIKSNRGSVWVKTLTIGCPYTQRHQTYHTYPIAIGPKNKNHEAAEQIIRKDLLKLSSNEGMPIYSKQHGGILQIRAKLMTSLQDQPERRGENYLTGGGSTYHRRFGYSFPWQEFENVLRPCINCRALLFDFTKAWDCNKKCLTCTNFAYDLEHELLRYTPELVGLGEGEEDLLGPLKLDYSLLTNAVSLAHDSYLSGDWTYDDLHAYLRLHCIKKEACDSILLHADKCKEYQDIIGDPRSSQELKMAVEQQKQNKPHLYEPWSLPALWTRGTDLEQHPDVPMHLLCLGVVKTLIIRIQIWMSKKCKESPFVRQMKGRLESIDALKLSWLKVLPYKGGKFGGWVSENYLSLSRILKWFYSLLHKISPDSIPWVEPARPQKEWTGEDCKAWLRLRGLKRSGCAADLRMRVSEYRCMTNVPQVIEQEGGPVETVQATVVALDEMISLLMVDQIENDKYYVELERKIRVFLTRFADMEGRLARKKDLPAWLSSYNFLSILNLPDIVRLYGPVRNIWEGGPQGEGMLRFIKPDMIYGLRKYWEGSTMKSLMRKKGMQVVVAANLGCDETMFPNKDIEEGSKLFHCYHFIHEVDDQIRQTKKPISVIFNSETVGVACKLRSEIIFVPLNRIGFQSTKMNLNYFYWERRIQEEYLPMKGTVQILGYGLLLPLLQMCEQDSDFFIRKSFALIDHKHRTLNLMGEFTV